MDFSFEAGLPEFWESYMLRFKYSSIKEKDLYIDFKSMAPISLILVFGYLISFLVFLYEKFH